MSHHLHFCILFFSEFFFQVRERYSNLNLNLNLGELNQIAKRYTVAMYQNIIFKEFLPLIIGKDLMKERNLSPLPVGSGYSTAYNDNVDARAGISWFIANRFQDSMVKRLLTLIDKDEKVERKELADYFERGCEFVRQGGTDRDGNPAGEYMNDLFRGMTQTYGAKSTNSASTTMKPNFLNILEFAPENTNDAIAITIMRGRDLGAPTYNRARQFCQTKDFGSVGSFDELMDDYIISEENVSLLKSEYSSVDDIDMFVGGMLEKPLPGALVGPTFACIIADQFSRLKNGDRFYFEYDTYEDPLTLEQIDEIREVTFSRLACLVLDNIGEVARNAFLLENDMVDCDKFPELTFGLAG